MIEIMEKENSSVARPTHSEQIHVGVTDGEKIYIQL